VERVVEKWGRAGALEEMLLLRAFWKTLNQTVNKTKPNQGLVHKRKMKGAV
jgi:hypothetical protein